MNTKKVIVSTIIRVVIVAILFGIMSYMTTNAVITNEVAVEQLNGGNEAYIAQGVYYKYRSALPFIGTIFILWSAYPLIKLATVNIINKVKEN